MVSLTPRRIFQVQTSGLAVDEMRFAPPQKPSNDFIPPYIMCSNVFSHVFSSRCEKRTSQPTVLERHLPTRNSTLAKADLLNLSSSQKVNLKFLGLYGAIEGTSTSAEVRFEVNPKEVVGSSELLKTWWFAVPLLLSFLVFSGDVHVNFYQTNSEDSPEKSSNHLRVRLRLHLLAC